MQKPIVPTRFVQRGSATSRSRAAMRSSTACAVPLPHGQERAHDAGDPDSPPVERRNDGEVAGVRHAVSDAPDVAGESECIVHDHDPRPRSSSLGCCEVRRQRPVLRLVRDHAHAGRLAPVGPFDREPITGTPNARPNHFTTSPPPGRDETQYKSSPQLAALARRRSVRGGPVRERRQADARP